MDSYDLKQLLLELQLTQAQARFCESYAIDANAEKAMTYAGYKSLGKFRRNAIAGLLHNEKILRYIKALRDNAFLRANITLDDVINEYKKMAFTNMADYVDWSASGIAIKSKATLTKDQQAGILEISETTNKQGVTVAIKLHPKQAALDKLYKMMTEMDEALASKRRKDGEDGRLSINRSNVLMMLSDPKQRRAIEGLAGGLLNMEVRLSERMQGLVEELVSGRVREKAIKARNLLPGSVDDGDVVDALTEDAAAQLESERYGGSEETRGVE